MKAITRHIPNAITSLNLFSGCLAISFAFRGQIDMAAYFIFAAAIFDFCDGMAARALKAYSPLGVQLDSLADVVSFGVAPSAMLYAVLSSTLARNAMLTNTDVSTLWELLTYFPFIIAVFSALRLAKFNIDTRQTESFLGLPTPANALLIASALAAATINGNVAAVIEQGVVIIVSCVVLSALLVSEIPMFSLKFKKQENTSAFFKKYSVQLMFFFLCIISPFFFGVFLAIAVMMVLYITLSVYRWLVRRS